MAEEIHLRTSAIDLHVNPDSEASIEEAARALDQIQAEIEREREKLAALQIERTRRRLEAAGWTYKDHGIYVPGPTMPPRDWGSPPSPELVAKFAEFTEMLQEQQ